jgi:hypothetical protein
MLFPLEGVDFSPIERQLREWENDSDIRLYPSSGHRRGYRLNYKVILSLQGNKQDAFLQFRPDNFGRNQLRIDFNPAKLGSEKLDRLNVFLQCLIGSDHYYSEWQNATISRIDFAVDLRNYELDDLLIFVRGKRRHGWGGGDNGIGLIQWGGDRSHLYYVAYDKAKELRSRGIIPRTDKLTRIEARIRGSMKWQDVFLLQNPFSRIHLYVARRAFAFPVSEIEYALFFDSCRLHGNINGALQRIPNRNKRERYRQYLAPLECSWWNPEAIWSQTHGALDRFNEDMCNPDWAA